MQLYGAYVPPEHIRKADKEVWDDIDNHPMIVCEMLGVSFRDVINAIHEGARDLELEMVMVYMRQVAIAVQRMHHCGIVHRDLKPGNIMVWFWFCLI